VLEHQSCLSVASINHRTITPPHLAVALLDGGDVTLCIGSFSRLRTPHILAASVHGRMRPRRRRRPGGVPGHHDERAGHHDDLSRRFSRVAVSRVTLRPGILVQRVWVTLGTSDSCKSWPLSFIARFHVAGCSPVPAQTKGPAASPCGHVALIGRSSLESRGPGPVTRILKKEHSA